MWVSSVLNLSIFKNNFIKHCRGKRGHNWEDLLRFAVKVLGQSGGFTCADPLNKQLPLPKGLA